MTTDTKLAKAKVICSKVAEDDFDRLLGRAYRKGGQHSARHLLISHGDMLDMIAKHPDAGELGEAESGGWRKIVMSSAPVWMFYSVWSDSIIIERFIPISESTAP